MAKLNKKRVFLFLVLPILIVSGFLSYKVLTSVKLVEAVVVEAGSNPPSISEFFEKEQKNARFITNMSKVPLGEPGIYEIKLQVKNKEYATNLEVKDTVAPEAETVEYEIWPEERKEPADFVKNIVDITNVNVTFQEEPDFNKAGEQDVFLVLEDTSGNKTIEKTTLTIKADTEPPVIEGVKDQTIFAGDKLSYKKDVTVTDNRDKDVKLEIDSNAVNLKKVGSYEVVYRAIDTAGNTATAKATIHVKEKPADHVDPDELYAAADKVLASILKDGMSDIEKAWEIYKWVKGNIAYTGSSDKSDWMKGAMRGLKRGTGDCYNYYATSRLLLTRAGIENQTVIRDGGKTRHYWNLVYISDGWYHFDTTPYVRPYTAFLRTDAEVAERTKVIKDYYKFDKSKHPATPEKPLEERSRFY